MAQHKFRGEFFNDFSKFLEISGKLEDVIKTVQNCLSELFWEVFKRTTT